MSQLGDMHTREELEAMLPLMAQASNEFYPKAQRIGNHAFIEFTGLMNEYIQICRRSLEREVDFAAANVHSGVSLEPEDYQVKYMCEKFECIFGAMFQKKKYRDMFREAMGWPPEVES